MASAWQDECALRQTQGALIIVVALVNALEVGRHVAGARYLITFEICYNCPKPAWLLPSRLQGAQVCCRSCGQSD